MSSQLYIGNGQAAPAVVVEKSTPMPYSIQKILDENGKIINSSILMDLTNIRDIGNYVFYFQHSNTIFPSNTEIVFPSLIKISGQCACSYMFSGCGGIISVSFPLLTEINSSDSCHSMCSGCNDLANINLPLLKKIGPSSQACRFMFNGCSKLTNVEFPSLSDINGSMVCRYMFSNCSNLKSISFPALTSNSFGSYSNQFENLVGGVTGCTIHFPSNLESKVPTLSQYPNFGGTNTVLLYDLPATE